MFLGNMKAVLNYWIDQNEYSNINSTIWRWSCLHVHTGVQCICLSVCLFPL